MTQTAGRHGVDGPTTQAVPLGEIGHLDLDIAMEHARQLRVDHLRWMVVQGTQCARYVRSLIRRALCSQMSNRADPAR